MPTAQRLYQKTYILENIVTLKEAIEYVKESDQDYIFFKIDFDKAFDRLNLQSTLDALQHMECGANFCAMVKTLLGNAST